MFKAFNATKAGSRAITRSSVFNQKHINARIIARKIQQRI